MRFLGYRDYASHVTDRQHGVRYGGGLVLILLSSHTCFLYASHCLPGHFVLDTAFGNDCRKDLEDDCLNYEIKSLLIKIGRYYCSAKDCN
jgi:hypothetical protein